MAPDGLAYTNEVHVAARQAMRWADLEGFARESWWLGLGPVAFYRRVREEASRLRRSRYGRVVLSASELPAMPLKRGAGRMGGE